MASDATDHCSNCGVQRSPGGRYCSACGQQAATPRLTWREIGRELLHALVHVDRSALSLIRGLIVRPGIVAREYVLGRRKRYFGPFAFLAVTVAIASLLVEISGFRLVYPGDSHDVAADVLQRFLSKHVNLLFFAQVPVLAAACRLLAPRGRFNSAEYLVLAAYTSGVRILVSAFVVIPLWYLSAGREASLGRVLYAYMVLWDIYFGFAMAQFLATRPLVSALKGIVAAAIAQAVTALAASSAATALVSVLSRR